jgi:hypothetical protein
LNTGLYLLFIPGFAVLTLLIGSAVAFIAFSDRIEYADDDGEVEPAQATPSAQSAH